MMLAASLIALGLITFGSRWKTGVDEKRLADERRRQSMREVAERWHFRQWELDLRSSDSV